jgi:hypothetical protein
MDAYLELINPLTQAAQALVGQDYGVGQIGRQLGLDQAPDLCHAQSKNVCAGNTCKHARSLSDANLL